MSSTLLLSEASPPTSKRPISIGVEREDLSRAISEWKLAPTAGHLGDVLSFSVAEDCIEDVRGIAREVLKRGDAVTVPQKVLMEGLVSEETKEESVFSAQSGICNPHIQTQVREIRALLRTNPENPLVLLDFAQLQLAAGKAKQAERALLSALTISPNNRLILRTIARFYVHANRERKAHEIIAGHPRTRIDPWLMASEVALSQTAGVQSKFIKSGSNFVGEKHASYADVSELAGAVAGIELLNGNSKRARDFFRIALLQPNDNVIAQAITNQRILTLDLSKPIQRRVALGAAEARTLLAWESLKTEVAEMDALRWHAEEPFSSRPLQFLTTLYAVDGNYKVAAMLAKRGLVADPSEAVLMANLSYALACMGSLDEAEKVAKKTISLDRTRFEAHTNATRGLIEMKKGRFDEADALYGRAIEIFERKHEVVLEAICHAYYARAAFDTNHPHIEMIIARAVEFYNRSPSTDAAIILRKLRSDIQEPPREEPMRKLGQWVFDEERNILVRKEGITAIGASEFVVKSRKTP